MKKSEGNEGTCGRGGQPNPFLLPLVIQKIVSPLDKKDLKSARMVCREWHKISTEAYIGLECIEASVKVTSEGADHFIVTMTPSQWIPAVRLILHIDLVSFNLTDLLKLLEFIAPFVIKIVFRFSACTRMYDAPQHDEVAHVSQLLAQLDLQDQEQLNFPPMQALEVLDLDCCFGIRTDRFRDAVISLMKRIVVKADNLKSFCSNFRAFGTDDPRAEGTIIKELPVGCKKLRFNISGAQNVTPYEAFMDTRFQLEELVDFRSSVEGVVNTLILHKSTLKRLHLLNLEKLYKDFYATFPVLLTVEKLSTSASLSSTFEFLQPFWNVVEVCLHVNRLDEQPTRANVGKQSRENFPQHQSVRKLYINFFPSIDETISFELLSHVFPNVTHLSFYSSTVGTWRQLTQLFTYFPDIEWLCIPFYRYDPGANELESILSGIPVSVCKAMKTSGNFDGSMFGSGVEAEDFGIGLNHLKRLKTLEIRTAPYHYAHIFTKVTFHRVFMRMESLKEIRFLLESKIPAACKPFLQPLRAKGIDFYRMNRRLEGSLQDMFGPL